MQDRKIHSTERKRLVVQAIAESTARSTLHARMTGIYVSRCWPTNSDLTPSRSAHASKVFSGFTPGSRLRLSGRPSGTAVREEHVGHAVGCHPDRSKLGRMIKIAMFRPVTFC